MGLKLPIGIDNFRKVREDGYHYIDKSMFIAEVLDTSAETQLIIRPRRFGKTINMSMLQCFFDLNSANGADLFKGLAIEQSEWYAHLSRYPVIFLSFKDLKALSFEEFLDGFSIMAAEAFRSRKYLLEKLDEFEADDFMTVARQQCSTTKLMHSLRLLMTLLHRHHGRKVILLIDEYDSPIHSGYGNGYYKEIVAFMRGLLGKALKSNDALEKAVLTGILRVARESIFSDLNQVMVFSVLSHTFADKFGFTEAETENLLKTAGLADQTAEVRRWYNGYLAGETTIYNPWSILHYIATSSEGFKPHWVNTSSNDLIRDQIVHAAPEVLDDLQRLLRGESVETAVQEQTVFDHINQDAQTLWSFFLFCGYLKVTSKVQRGDRWFYDLAVPNTEIKLLLQDIVEVWLRRGIGSAKVKALLESLVTGDVDLFGTLLAQLVKSVLSFYDTAEQNPERVYHAFVLGLLVHLGDRYEIRSNREAGYGRYDLSMRPRDASDRGVILEFKVAKSAEEMKSVLQEGLDQIETRHYGAELEDAGVALRSEIAVAFYGKDVRVRGREVDAR
ncbi:MAG: AAA family ATPase [Acidobacteriota bacterium]|nr:AAA family ATPase [Acidobacteriota bacterium]